MSTLQVANLHFEATGNNRLQYTGSNGYLLIGGGANVAVINSSAIYFPLNLNINNFTVNAITVTNTISGTDMTLSGNLIVSGSLTYVNTTTLNIGDNIITLNADLSPSAAPSENAGFEINRGSSANVQLRWNETSDIWQTTADGTNYYNLITSANTANATVAGVTTIVDSVINTSNSTAAAANSVKNAYDRAIDANTRAFSAQTAAGQAYSNAIAYSGNAVQAYTNAVSVASSDATSKAATAYSNAIATASSDATSKAATAYSNAIAWSGNAALAYSNAVSVASSDATSKAATAYSNAIAYSGNAVQAYTNAVSTAASDATSKAATAYSNAIAYSGNAALAYSNAIAWSGNAALAYSNAVSTAASDATSKAATAYSNAIAWSGNAALAYSNAVSVASSDATSKAATAYSNAMSTTLSRVGVYTANNTFGGSNTTVSSNLNVTGTFLNVASAFVANSTGAYHTGTINAASHTVGTTFTANATLVNAAAINITGQVNTATLYATTSANIGTAVIANSIGLTSTGFVNAATVVNSASHTVGTSLVANSTGVYHTGTVNSASHTVGTSFTANSTVVNSVSYYSGTLLVANTTVINATHIGGTPASSVVNTTAAFTRTGNTTFNANVILGSSAVAVGLQANGSYGTAGQILTSNGTASFWRSSANTANNLVGGAFGSVPFQSDIGQTSFVSIGSPGQVLKSGHTILKTNTDPYWDTIPTIYSETDVSTASSLDLTLMNSTVSRITLLLQNVVLSSLTSNLRLRLGDSSSTFESTGYIGGWNHSATLSGYGTSSSFFSLYNSGGNSHNISGRLTLFKFSDSKTWILTGNLFDSVSNNFINVIGKKATSATTDSLQLSTGSGTFTSGTVAYYFE